MAGSGYLPPVLWLWGPGASPHLGMAVSIPGLGPGLCGSDAPALAKGMSWAEGRGGLSWCRNSSPDPRACSTCLAGAPLTTLLPQSQLHFEISTSDCPLVHQASVTGGLSFVAVRFFYLWLYLTHGACLWPLVN